MTRHDRFDSDEARAGHAICDCVSNGESHDDFSSSTFSSGWTENNEGFSSIRTCNEDMIYESVIMCSLVVAVDLVDGPMYNATDSRNFIPARIEGSDGWIGSPYIIALYNHENRSRKKRGTEDK